VNTNRYVLHIKMIHIHVNMKWIRVTVEFIIGFYRKNGILYTFKNNKICQNAELLATLTNLCFFLFFSVFCGAVGVLPWSQMSAQACSTMCRNIVFRGAVGVSAWIRVECFPGQLRYKRERVFKGNKKKFLSYFMIFSSLLRNVGSSQEGVKMDYDLKTKILHIGVIPTFVQPAAKRA
jgi:hypothetical protein